MEGGAEGEVLVSSAPPSQARSSPAQAVPDPPSRRPAAGARLTRGRGNEAPPSPSVPGARARGKPSLLVWPGNASKVGGCGQRAWAWPRGAFNLVLSLLR